MLERFTEGARRVVVVAEEEARSLTHGRVGTEHIVLGLLRDRGSLAAQVLTSLAVTIDGVRAEVVRIVSPGEEVTSARIPFTPRVRKVLELALREAISLGHNDVRAEHILLGLVRENHGVGARILGDVGAGFAQVRSEVFRRLDAPLRRPPPRVSRRIDDATPGAAFTLEDLWERYQATGDERARERLVVAYSPLVKHVAGRLSSALPAHVEESDLISHGLTGLISAIERFQPSRAIKFETYAVTRIRGSIVDELRTLDCVPRSVRAQARDIERANQKLEAELHRTPTDDEIATELGLGIADFREALLQIAHSTIVRLDQLWTIPGCHRGSSDHGGVSLLDLLPDRRAPNPQALVDQGEWRNRLADAVATLPKREKLVMVLSHNEQLTVREVSEVLGVSESQVVQLHTKAVLRLRSKLAQGTN